MDGRRGTRVQQCWLRHSDSPRHCNTPPMMFHLQMTRAETSGTALLQRSHKHVGTHGKLRARWDSHSRPLLFKWQSKDNQGYTHERQRLPELKLAIKVMDDRRRPDRRRYGSDRSLARRYNDAGTSRDRDSGRVLGVAMIPLAEFEQGTRRGQSPSRRRHGHRRRHSHAKSPSR